MITPGKAIAAIAEPGINIATARLPSKLQLQQQRHTLFQDHREETTYHYRSTPTRQEVGREVLRRTVLEFFGRSLASRCGVRVFDDSVACK